MDLELSKEEQDFLNSFRNFCYREITPYINEAEKNGEIPKSHFQKLYDIGYNGLLYKEEWGGSNSSYLLATLAQEILSEHCGATFFSTGASIGLFGLALQKNGSEEQKKRFLPSIVRGEKIGSLAITEPNAGTDVSRIQTSLKKVGNELILNGQKTYITNAPICDYSLVLADYQGVGQTCIVLDMSGKGISRGKPMDKLGLKGSPTGEIFFEDVRITEKDIMGRPGRGFMMVMDAFNRERLALGAYSVGVMAACLSDCKKYSKERKSFGRMISKHQSVAFMLADIFTKYEAARTLLHEAAWMMDQFADAPKRQKQFHNGHLVDLTAKTATVKLLASTYAREVTNLAVQIHGGAGYMEEFRVARLFRDVKIAEIGGGTSEIMKQIIAHSEAKRVQ